MFTCGCSCVLCVQPPPGGEGQGEQEQTEDKRQKENTAYAKKMVLRLAGLMGLGGAVSMVYVFGELDRDLLWTWVLPSSLPSCVRGEEIK